MYIYGNISRIPRRMRVISNRICRENQNLLCHVNQSPPSPESHAVS